MVDLSGGNRRAADAEGGFVDVGYRQLSADTVREKIRHRAIGAFHLALQLLSQISIATAAIEMNLAATHQHRHKKG